MTQQEFIPFPRLPLDGANPKHLDIASRRLLSHELLYKSLDLAIDFNNDRSNRKGEYLAAQFEDFTQAASWVPGYKGAFGTGYPFYAQRDDGSVVAVEEISRFISETKVRAKEDEASRVGEWACGMCQIAVEHVDLKQKCKPCTAQVLKPRDMFKALPDLDYWIVVEQDSPHVEGAASSILQRAGFQQSDADIYFAVHDTIEVLTALKGGREPRARLPLDLHIVTVDQLKGALLKVQTATSQGFKDKVPISPRSLHIVWEDVDEPYDFLKDFLLSFTVGGILDPELGAMIKQTQEIVAAHSTPKQVIDALRLMHPKEQRQLETKELQTLLQRRLESWKGGVS